MQQFSSVRPKSTMSLIIADVYVRKIHLNVPIAYISEEGWPTEAGQ